MQREAREEYVDVEEVGERVCECVCGGERGKESEGKRGRAS